MRTFVTGSTGLLGNNLVRTLLASGHEVLALARSKEKAARELGDTDANVVIGDMTDVSAFAGALSGVDVLFHTAAYFREYYGPGDHAAQIDRINVEATMELARAAHTRGVRKMIHTSSSILIGLKPDGSPGDETTEPSPIVAHNLYFLSKRKAEALLRDYSRETGLFIAFVLPAWMWGPHDAAPTPSGQLVHDALLHKLPPAVPPGGGSVVDARDVAAAMLRIAEIGRSGERYIASGMFVQLHEIVTLLAALTGARGPKTRLPYSAALAMAAGGGNVVAHHREAGRDLARKCAPVQCGDRADGGESGTRARCKVPPLCQECRGCYRMDPAPAGVHARGAGSRGCMTTGLNLIYSASSSCAPLRHYRTLPCCTTCALRFGCRRERTSRRRDRP
jgi:dihydroflavonol-4-reductase